MKTLSLMRSLTALLLCIALLLALPAATVAQNTEPDTAVRIKTDDGSVVKLYDASYALVVGISDYIAGWADLPGVNRDVPLVKAALEKQGFLVTVMMNPTRAAFDDAMRKFINDNGYDAGNRLLIYFAGHGYTQKDATGNRELGYIVPADAPRPSLQERRFRQVAISMDTVEAYARQIEAKHALFVFDSCFSGSLVTKTRGMVPPIINAKTTQPVRQFITAGADSQEVPDVSVFREQFVEGLEGEADLNRDGYVTGSELATHLQDKVTNYTREAQTPQYGKIRDALLDRGDFVFVLPRVNTPPRIPATGAATKLPTVEPAAIELAFWDAIKTSADPQDYKDYLEKYPNGQFAALARRRANPTVVGNTAANTSAATPARPATTTAAPKRAVTTQAGIELVYIPAGVFQMGSSTSDQSDEKPVHEVTISNGFYMGKYEVTQGEWERVMGTSVRQQRDKVDPNYLIRGEGANYPMYYVSWDEAQEYIRRLNAKNDGFTYRLPSEAEWEYACRAGTTGDYAGVLDAMAWYDGNSNKQTHPVGMKQANAFGLFDTHGNVWEWCEDWYHDTYTGAPTDGSAWLSGGEQKYRVLRGGSWVYYSSSLRSADRYGYTPGSRLNLLGFRVVAFART